MWLFWGSKFRDYGLRLVGGSFWAWKTKNVFQNAYLWKKENPKWLLIANVPYDFVDIYFSSKDDLNKVLMYLKRYIEETNIVEFMKAWYKIPIKLIIDEWHIYYFARDFKALDKEILLILTQCRKRRISIDIITQELRQIDVFMRNLSPYVYWYNDIFLWVRKQSVFYMPNGDVTNVTDEKVEEIDKEFLMPDRWQKLFNRGLQTFFDQRFLTYHIIWLWSHFQLSYDEFYDYLKNKDEINKAIINWELSEENVKSELTYWWEETTIPVSDVVAGLQENQTAFVANLTTDIGTINGFTSHRLRTYQEK